jgi:ribosome-binding factor A
MVASNRVRRISMAVQVELAKIIQHEISDNRLKTLTITSVDVARDLSLAKIYFVTHAENDSEQMKRLVALLSKAAHFLRRRLAQKIELRVIPKLHFCYDTSEITGRRIDDLLKNI